MWTVLPIKEVKSPKDWLEHLLFKLFIQDLELWVSREVIAFVGDNRAVRTKTDCGRLQKDISNLGEWALKWQMWFSGSKRCVMHVGLIILTTYTTQGLWTGSDWPRSSLMKILTQCAAAVKKSNSLLRIIRKGFKIKQPILYCHWTNLWFGHA